MNLYYCIALINQYNYFLKINTVSTSISRLSVHLRIQGVDIFLFCVSALFAAKTLRTATRIRFIHQATCHRE